MLSERGLGHTHPVVGGPRLGAVVEVEAHDGAAAGHVRHHHVREGLERVRGDLQRHRDVLPRRVHEPAAQARWWREPDGVQRAVHPVPPATELVPHRRDLRRVGDVELQHIRRLRQLASGALGEREATPGAGEDHLRALFLREPRHAERERGVGEHAGDEDPLAIEEGHGP